MAQDSEKCKKPSNQPFNLGLLGASFETQNFGVAALACGAVASVCHSYPTARIFIVDYAKTPATYQVAHHNGSATVDLVNIRFSKRFYLENNIARLLATAIFIRLLPLGSLKSRLLLRNAVLRVILEADIIGSVAGGDSFSDIYGIQRLIYVALPQILVLLLKKPLILLPQTLGPFKSTFAKAVARYIFRHAQKAYSRDFEGLRLARKYLHGDHSKLRFCYDMGFVMEPRISEIRVPEWLSHINPKIPLVGLNVSGLLYMGGYTKKNMFGLKVDYRRLMHDIIDYFVKKHNAHIMLVPHVFGTEENSESDVIACRKVYHETNLSIRGHLHLVEENYDQHELKALIGRCHFFIGSRMHACIGALSQCIPALGLAYSKKFIGVFETIGMESLVIDLRAQDQTDIAVTISKRYEKRAEYKSRLEAGMARIQKSIFNLFSNGSDGN